MQKFDQLTGAAAPMPMANIDTDQIIPKQFLKTVEREGLATGLFYDFRYDMDGQLKPDFVLNQPAYKGVKILIAGDNFGCGSSREHAPWALMDFGVRCVIAPSFADIFSGNSTNNGLLLVALPEAEIEELMDEARGGNHSFTIDLETQTVTAPAGTVHRFEIDPDRKHKLLNGLDPIAESLLHAAAIDTYEARRDLQQPWAAA